MGAGQDLSLVSEARLRGVSCELTAAHPEEPSGKRGWENACNTMLKIKYFQNLQSKKRNDNRVYGLRFRSLLWEKAFEI